MTTFVVLHQRTLCDYISIMQTDFSTPPSQACTWSHSKSNLTIRYTQAVQSFFRIFSGEPPNNCQTTRKATKRIYAIKGNMAFLLFGYAFPNSFLYARCFFAAQIYICPVETTRNIQAVKLPVITAMVNQEMLSKK